MKSTGRGGTEMNTILFEERQKVIDRMNPLVSLPVSPVGVEDPALESLLEALSPEVPWGDRKAAAETLGCMRSREALPVLLEAVLADPFWMVRCAMIQAVEMIGSPEAVPTLENLACSDRFQVVRSYAARAVERLVQQDEVLG
jgi:HEAT repeat protein